MSEQNPAAAQNTPTPAAPEAKPTAAETKPAPEAAAAAASEAPAAGQPSGTDKPAETQSTANPPEKVAPEKYDLKLSEGSMLDPRTLTNLEAYAKANKLSQAEAQDLLKQQEADVVAFVESRKAIWSDQAIKDPEIGGANLKENIALASRVVERFGTDTLKKELDRTGYGNHPEMVKLLTRIGKSMADDTFIHPRNPGVNIPRPMEEVFYGKQGQ